MEIVNIIMIPWPALDGDTEWLDRMPKGRESGTTIGRQGIRDEQCVVRGSGGGGDVSWIATLNDVRGDDGRRRSWIICGVQLGKNN